MKQISSLSPRIKGLLRNIKTSKILHKFTSHSFSLINFPFKNFPICPKLNENISNPTISEKKRTKKKVRKKNLPQKTF